jgi:hypothetical protein
MNSNHKHIISVLHVKGYTISTNDMVQADDTIRYLINNNFIIVSREIHIGDDVVAILLTRSGMSIKKYYASIVHEPWRKDAVKLH